MFHKEFQFFVSFSCLESGNRFVCLICIGIHFSIERSGFCMKLHLRRRESALFTIGFIYKENLPRNGYDDQWSRYFVNIPLDRTPVAYLFKHPNIKKKFFLQKFKLTP